MTTPWQHQEKEEDGEEAEQDPAHQNEESEVKNYPLNNEADRPRFNSDGWQS